jgi:hypothetical protein
LAVVRLAGPCVALGLAAGLSLGCGEEVRDERRGAPKSDVRDVGGLDPEPETLDGSESREFEPEDSEAAAHVSRLIELYCEGRHRRLSMRAA